MFSIILDRIFVHVHWKYHKMLHIVYRYNSFIIVSLCYKHNFKQLLQWRVCSDFRYPPVSFVPTYTTSVNYNFLMNYYYCSSSKNANSSERWMTDKQDRQCSLQMHLFDLKNCSLFMRKKITIILLYRDKHKVIKL